MVLRQSVVLGPARVVRVPASLDLRVQALIEDPDSPYETLSDFAGVAFSNQLELELDSVEPPVAGGRSTATPLETVGAEPLGQRESGVSPDEAVGTEQIPALMVAVDEVPDQAIGTPDSLESEAMEKHLSFLVNRLNPLPPVCRSLARTAPQEFGGLRDAVGKPARVVGFRLKADDAKNNRPMVDRLATSWPVGGDADKSIDKFISAYIGDPTHPGALVQLGLGYWDALAQLRLTPRGAELARCESPIVDNDPESHGRVSDRAIAILVEAIASNPIELALVTTFLDAVAEHEGRQSNVDEELASRMGWSPDVAATTRAALVGRLRDLGIVEITGRGASAVISIVDSDRLPKAVCE